MVPSEIGNTEDRCDKEDQMRFLAEIRLSGKTATGIPVPAEVVESLGRDKRPPVRVTIKGHTYRSTVASVGGGAKKA
jgi:hypothetical protein